MRYWIDGKWRDDDHHAARKQRVPFLRSYDNERDRKLAKSKLRIEGYSEFKEHKTDGRLCLSVIS